MYVLRIYYSQQILNKSSKNQYLLYIPEQLLLPDSRQKYKDCLFRLYFTLVKCFLQTGFAFSEKAKLIVSTCWRFQRSHQWGQFFFSFKAFNNYFIYFKSMTYSKWMKQTNFTMFLWNGPKCDFIRTLILTCLSF